MKSFIPYSLIAAALTCGFASAQTPTTAYTTPVGYTTILINKNADTRVGLPFRQPTVAAAALTETPTNVLTVAGAAFGTYASTHYVKFTSGNANGKVYAITANDATTITIDLNGDTQAAVNGDTFSVSKFWMLKELFDPTLCTTDPATTGNAIVASPSQLATQRRTQILLPRSGSEGINLPSLSTFYVYGTTPSTQHWYKSTSTLVITDEQQLWPDMSLIIRHPANVVADTNYVCTGEVDMGTAVLPLITKAVGGADNAVCLTRPVDVTLNQLNLAGTSAFVSSPSTLATQRKDQILVYYGTSPAPQMNKPSTATYYYDGGASKWRRTTSTTYDAGNDIIPAGAGMIIRKAQGVAGTSFWSNTPSY